MLRTGIVRRHASCRSDDRRCPGPERRSAPSTCSSTGEPACHCGWATRLRQTPQAPPCGRPSGPRRLRNSLHSHGRLWFDRNPGASAFGLGHVCVSHGVAALLIERFCRWYAPGRGLFHSSFGSSRPLGEGVLSSIRRLLARMSGLAVGSVAGAMEERAQTPHGLAFEELPDGRQPVPAILNLRCVRIIQGMAPVTATGTRSAAKDPIFQGGIGGAEEDRTPDLRIANASLSQLSYGPTVLGRAGQGRSRGGRDIGHRAPPCQ